MANPDKTNRSEGQFVRKTASVSLAILMLLINVLVIGLQHKDGIRGYLADSQAKSGNYTSALRYVEAVESDEKLLESRYSVACIMQKNKDFDQAAEQFLLLAEYRDSADRYLSSCYDSALLSYRNGDLDRALELFSQLGGYSDAAAMKNEVVYRKAENAFADGEYAQAIMLFLSLGEYSDAPQRALEAAMVITGSEAEAEDMMANGGMTGEEMERSLRIAERRTALPEFSVAAGNYHTVVLRSDGTVAACGDNSSGQCNVSGWSNIVQVHAGAKHTVGLRADGTVVATGDNTFGQCDVSEWTEVTELAVNDYNTLALLSDGTVKNCGYNSYEAVERATGVAHIFAGGYAVSAVREDGSYLFSHKSNALQPTQRIIHASMNTGYSVALQSDGTALFSADLGEEWKDMVWVDAGSTAVIGVDVNGAIRSRFFRASDAVEMSTSQELLQCAAGTAHFVFLTASGDVIAFGDNSMGQCDVSGLR